MSELRLSRMARREPIPALPLLSGYAMTIDTPEKLAQATLVLSNNGIPAPPAPPLQIRYILRSDAWWALTESGWFWYDNRIDHWLPSYHGPLV
jgi:hypothetical protein